MQIGKLRHIVTIEYPQRSQNADTGEVIDTWVPVPGALRIHAEVLPDRATEFFGTRQVQSTLNAMIRLRWREGIDATMRVKHYLRDAAGTEPLVEYWDVQGAIHFQDRFRELRLMCLARDAEGFRRGSDLVNSETLPFTVTADSPIITADS